MKTEAICTWAEGPDVLVTVNQPFMLYECPSGSDKAVHGYVNRGSFHLTVEEAEQLGNQLLLAAFQARKLQSGWEDEMAKLCKNVNKERPTRSRE